MPDTAAPPASRLSHIIINKASTHNLKEVTVALPRLKFIVITGLSGSGKSSLAFDTLYAEGQRRYVESLSSYARQFLDRMDKPEVESIEGISPAIAIEQKVTSGSSRSTVGTSTEIYDYLKLLFARIGKTYSPISGQEVKRHTTTDVVNYIQSLDEGAKCIILSPLINRNDRTTAEQVQILSQQGYARVRLNGELKRLSDLDPDKLTPKDELFVVIDRIVIQHGDEENESRIGDSVETAFFEGNGVCAIGNLETPDELTTFSNRFELDGINFETPNIHFFSFNNPVGACKTCEGYGSVIGIDPEAVIPNKRLSIFEDGVAAWRGEKMAEWKNELIYSADKFGFPIHRPINQLSDKEIELLWTGNKYFKGLNKFFKYIESKSYKIQYRVMLSRYRGKTTCPECKGSRLRKDATYVKIDGYSIVDLLKMPVSESLSKIRKLNLSDHDKEVSKRLMIEIINRLQYLNDVGLSYISLNRLSNTLSVGNHNASNYLPPWEAAWWVVCTFSMNQVLASIRTIQADSSKS